MSTTARTLRYGIEDKPPALENLGFGFQHLLTMFGATISVPLIIGPAVGLNAEQMAMLVSSVLICSGIATFLQVSIGTRLPIVQGVSFSFIAPFAVIIAQTTGGEVTMQYIAGALIGGAVVEILVGYLGVFGRIRRFVSPVVIGPVIMLIGLSLFGVAAPQAGGNWWLAGYTILAVFGFSLMLSNRAKAFSLYPIMLAIVSAYVLAWILSAVGVIDKGQPGHIDFGSLSNYKWVRNPIDVVFPFGAPKFKAGFILSTLAGFLASMIESFGQYHASARVSGVGDPTDEQVNRGIGAKGLGSLGTGLFGGLGTTSYAENIGLVALTKVASRTSVLVCAGLLVFLGLFEKFGALLATIPSPILGGMYLTLFGLIAGVGVSSLARADLSSERNILIVGFCLFLGLSLPAYFANATVTISWADWLADIIKSVGSAGMAVAAIAGLILDNVIPGTPDERGLTVRITS